MPPSLPQLGTDPTYFPDPTLAFTYSNGLLAMGGDLSAARLLAAYQQGIFPWYEQEPILWWCPDPRAVLFLKDFKVRKKLKKTLKTNQFNIRVDENFTDVIRACAAPRYYASHTETKTWISPAMQAAYQALFEQGYAHCIEVYQQEQLVGGLYGVCIGRNFSAESMFSRRSEASKVALYYLVKQLSAWGFEWIDCQVWSEHLATLGVRSIPRSIFLAKVTLNNQFETKVGKWTFDKNLSQGSFLTW